MALLLSLLAVTPANAAEVMSVTARSGQPIRVLIERPARPVGVVVLLAGGAGDLRLGPDGSIGRLRNNQLVRTRGLYAAAGWAAALPDIAPEFREEDGVREGYRLSAAHAEDLGAVIAAMRRIARPLVLIGTSRGVLSAANAAARLSGDRAPDALVLTAGMLMNEGFPDQPSIQRDIPGIAAYRGPVLLLHHQDDACRVTPPSGPARLRPLLTGAARVEIVMLRGGLALGRFCEAQHYHGFNGLDEEVVGTILRFAASVAHAH